MSDLPPTDPPLTAGDLVDAVDRVLNGPYPRGLESAQDQLDWSISYLTQAVNYPRPATSAASERERLARAVYAKRPSWMIHPENRALTWEEAADDAADRVACIYRDVDAILAALASPPVSERERELEAEVIWLRDALLGIVESDHYRRYPKQYEDGGLRGQSGLRAVRALTGKHGSYLTDDDVRAHEVKHRANRSLTAQPAGEGK